MTANRGTPPNLAFDEEIKAVLQRRNHASDDPLLKEVTTAFKYNNDKILGKIKCYKVAGSFLLLAIPIVSAINALLVNIPDGRPARSLLTSLGASLPLLSLLLALLTALNSIYKPGVRFERCCRIGLDLFHWRCAFLGGLEKLSPLNDNTFADFVMKELKVFRRIQKADINLALPDQT